MKKRELLDDTINKALGSGKTVSVLVVSMDYLKEIYDAKGHTATRVFEQLERLIEARQSNCFRYGGGVVYEQNFVIVIEGGAEATALAESIRADVVNMRLDFWPELRLTVSIGVVTSSPKLRTAHDICAAADRALHSGQARSRLYGESGYERNHVFVA